MSHLIADPALHRAGQETSWGLFSHELSCDRVHLTAPTWSLSPSWGKEGGGGGETNKTTKQTNTTLHPPNHTENKQKHHHLPHPPRLLRLKKPSGSLVLSGRLKKSFSPDLFDKGEPRYLYHSWQIYSLHSLRFPLQSNGESIASASNLSWYATILLRKVYTNSVSEICFAAV